MKLEKNMPGYSGYNPSKKEVNEVKPNRDDKLRTNSKVPGYTGFIQNVKSDNIIGKSYGKIEKE